MSAITKSFWEEAMSHFRRAVGTAVVLNTVIAVGEAVAGVGSHSLSLILDSAHNFSDELALVCLFLAFYLPDYLGRQSQRMASVLNSLGLIVLSGVIIAQAFIRLRHPVPVNSLVPILSGLAAALANYGVARLLREAASHNASVRLTYLHNLGDVWISLAPVVAGALVLLTGRNEADALVALCIGVWLAVSTIREVRSSADELLWPDRIECNHASTEHA
jgi:cation diffusion facilitator family transporter